MDEQTGLRVTGCPECGAPAEVVPEGRLASTSGPVAIVRIRCAERHWFLMAEDQLPPVPVSLRDDHGSSSHTQTSPGPRATSRRPPDAKGTQTSACVPQQRQMGSSARITGPTD